MSTATIKDRYELGETPPLGHAARRMYASLIRSTLDPTRLCTATMLVRVNATVRLSRRAGERPLLEPGQGRLRPAIPEGGGRCHVPQ